MPWPILDELLAAQHECVGVWQLVERGWAPEEVRWRLPRAGLQPVFRMDGVWTSARGPLSDLQRWSAATRTAPGTSLALVSAARFRRIVDRRRPELIITVQRRGKGDWRLHGDVNVRRTPKADFEVVDGIPVVPTARLLADLAATFDTRALRRAVIEALRITSVTVDAVRAELPRRRGAPKLRAILDAVEDLPIARCRSNAEATALVRLKESGRAIPAVNVQINGVEADLVDFERREITEIDGPAFHQDPEADAARDRHYAAAGFRVRRRPSSDAYDGDARW